MRQGTYDERVFLLPHRNDHHVKLRSEGDVPSDMSLWSTVYELEIVVSGGLTGMAIVHDLFCAGSAGVLGYLRQEAPGLGHRELSLLPLIVSRHRAGWRLAHTAEVPRRGVIDSKTSNS
ncbi:hypothetical protein LX15_002501 [Streptoalloteichus tenebrarius]|uniref:Uncharacterized protein n=1 Tax=Streptoalloteichus tenebrarius (strain ATCC 17920 / DSM 40477 / JCM 4838 / CBS 697.72 / NBRC 16177 / NCIMB 11028 / NRRL B-12390 / A12253. 1 / ISP 5477) TaxID=1933 RepID=A0ABT1HTI8_STRSD|nr:hypothetical protein [Streptoalloteichus tenebrarius]MCP2258803.1 hypothetical protein [Streptoalloteichus tenebrarius]BFE99517.1 hypothetical protein GCM10020241_11930 [Streptoalloteichus tenebrarius]